MKLQAGHLRLVDQDLYLGENTTPIKLTLKEALLLAVLMQHPGQVVNRETLMREVWQRQRWKNAPPARYARQLRVFALPGWTDLGKAVLESNCRLDEDWLL